MRYAVGFYLLLLMMAYSAPASAQLECGGNTGPQTTSHNSSIMSGCQSPMTLAEAYCGSVGKSVKSVNATRWPGDTQSGYCMHSNGSTSHSFQHTQCGASSDQCGCDAGANSIVNANGDAVWCSDPLPDPEPTIEECGNSWDAYTGGCGTLPADCAASGGAFGWVDVGSGQQIVCLPAGEGGEPPACGVDGFLCNDATPSDPGGGNPSNSNDPDAPADAGTNSDGGVDGTESGGTGANSTGTCDPGLSESCTGANGWGDPCDPAVDANCTPVAAGDGESNDEKGVCDPEQPGYFECITSGGISIDPNQYEQGDRTIDSIFGEFSTAMEGAVVVTGITDFFTIDMAGSCPVWSVQTGIFDVTIDQLCSDQIPWDLIYGIMIAVASLLAARIAFT